MVDPTKLPSTFPIIEFEIVIPAIYITSQGKITLQVASELPSEVYIDSLNVQFSAALDPLVALYCPTNYDSTKLPIAPQGNHVLVYDIMNAPSTISLESTSIKVFGLVFESMCARYMTAKMTSATTIVVGSNDIDVATTIALPSTVAYGVYFVPKYQSLVMYKHATFETPINVVINQLSTWSHSYSVIQLDESFTDADDLAFTGTPSRVFIWSDNSALRDKLTDLNVRSIPTNGICVFSDVSSCNLPLETVFRPTWTEAEAKAFDFILLTDKMFVPENINLPNLVDLSYSMLLDDGQPAPKLASGDTQICLFDGVKATSSACDSATGYTAIAQSDFTCDQAATYDIYLASNIELDAAKLTSSGTLSIKISALDENDDYTLAIKNFATTKYTAINFACGDDFYEHIIFKDVSSIAADTITMDISLAAQLRQVTCNTLNIVLGGSDGRLDLVAVEHINFKIIEELERHDKHDTISIRNADVVLIGPSRTSKCFLNGYTLTSISFEYEDERPIYFWNCRLSGAEVSLKNKPSQLWFDNTFDSLTSQVVSFDFTGSVTVYTDHSNLETFIDKGTATVTSKPLPITRFCVYHTSNTDCATRYPKYTAIQDTKLDDVQVHPTASVIVVEDIELKSSQFMQLEITEHEMYNFVCVWRFEGNSKATITFNSFFGEIGIYSTHFIPKGMIYTHYRAQIPASFMNANIKIAAQQIFPMIDPSDSTTYTAHYDIGGAQPLIGSIYLTPTEENVDIEFAGSTKITVGSCTLIHQPHYTKLLVDAFGFMIYPTGPFQCTISVNDLDETRAPIGLMGYYTDITFDSSCDSLETQLFFVYTHPSNDDLVLRSTDENEMPFLMRQFANIPMSKYEWVQASSTSFEKMCIYQEAADKAACDALGTSYDIVASSGVSKSRLLKMKEVAISGDVSLSASLFTQNNQLIIADVDFPYGSWSGKFVILEDSELELTLSSNIEVDAIAIASNNVKFDGSGKIVTVRHLSITSKALADSNCQFKFVTSLILADQAGLTLLMDPKSSDVIELESKLAATTATPILLIVAMTEASAKDFTSFDIDFGEQIVVGKQKVVFGTVASEWGLACTTSESVPVKFSQEGLTSAHDFKIILLEETPTVWFDDSFNDVEQGCVVLIQVKDDGTESDTIEAVVRSNSDTLEFINVEGRGDSYFTKTEKPPKSPSGLKAWQIALIVVGCVVVVGVIAVFAIVLIRRRRAPTVSV